MMFFPLANFLFGRCITDHFPIPDDQFPDSLVCYPLFFSVLYTLFEILVVFSLESVGKTWTWPREGPVLLKDVFGF